MCVCIRVEDREARENRFIRASGWNEESSFHAESFSCFPDTHFGAAHGKHLSCSGQTKVMAQISLEKCFSSFCWHVRMSCCSIKVFSVRGTPRSLSLLASFSCLRLFAVMESLKWALALISHPDLGKRFRGLIAPPSLALLFADLTASPWFFLPQA